MFVTLNQFYVFLACVSFGAIGGIIFSIFAIIKTFVSFKAFEVLCDVFCMIILSLAFSVFSYKFNFPNIRIYMILGVLIGLTMYLKSFHRILANFAKKFYNITIQKFTKGKGRKNDRNKGEKANSGVNRRGSVITVYSGVDNGLSNDYDKRKEKSYRIFRKPNRKI